MGPNPLFLVSLYEEDFRWDTEVEDYVKTQRKADIYKSDKEDSKKPTLPTT